MSRLATRRKAGLKARTEVAPGPAAGVGPASQGRIQRRADRRLSCCSWSWACWLSVSCISGATAARACPKSPALGDVKEKPGQVGDKLRETKTTGSVKAALELRRAAAVLVQRRFRHGWGGYAEGRGPERGLKRLAGQVAGAVPDVARIDNQVRVNPRPWRPPGNDRTVGENLDDKTLEARRSALAFSPQPGPEGHGHQGQRLQAHRHPHRAVAASEAQRQLAVGIARDDGRRRHRPDRRVRSVGSAAGEPAVKAAAACRRRCARTEACAPRAERRRRERASGAARQAG